MTLSYIGYPVRINFCIFSYLDTNLIFNYLFVVVSGVAHGLSLEGDVRNGIVGLGVSSQRWNGTKMVGLGVEFWWD